MSRLEALICVLGGVVVFVTAEVFASTPAAVLAALIFALVFSGFDDEAADNLELQKRPRAR